MLLRQYTLILFIIIIINYSNTTKTTTIQSIDKKDTIEKSKIQNDLKIDQKSIKNTDVIRINIGGEIIMTTRQTLTRIPQSILSIMFNGHWENKLSKDKNGNIFLDFNPILFRHLLDQLQIMNENSIHIYLPSQQSLIEPFKKMIKKLNLNQYLSSKNNIINFNIGGQIITNQHETFNQISNSTFDFIVSSSKIQKFHDKSNIFLDYHPKVFENLIKQLREESFKNICKLEVSTNQEKKFFKKIINDLNICQQPTSFKNITANTKWKQNGLTIAGGNGLGNQSNQLTNPDSIYLNDDHQSIYITDYLSHRIVEWKFNAKDGQVIAGGNGKGNRTDQLNGPTDVIIDKKNNSLIICDKDNRRVMRWSRQNYKNGQIIISNIDCSRLAMDNNGDLYISDAEKDEVRRWKIGDANGTIVAGGNDFGSKLNQLHNPTFIFVDQDQSVYITDQGNHRIMKWMKGAKEGIVVAGGQGKGNSSTQLFDPAGIVVDHLGNIYIGDSYNHRVMRWSKGSKEGTIIVGGNKYGERSNQLDYPTDLSFDQQGNLYVVDSWNGRVQKFYIDSN